MKSLSAILIAICITLTTVDSGNAQVKKPQEQRPPVPRLAGQLASIQDIQQWVVSMRDEKLSAITLAQIADVTWPIDEDYARALFRFSLNKISIGQNDAAKEITAKNAANRRIIAFIAKHDMAWSKVLIDNHTKDAAKKANTQLEIANTLLESDPKRAADYAEQSFQSQINQGQIHFLKRLRHSDEERADQLFIRFLGLFLGQPNLDANDFAMLGTYLFRSRIADQEEDSIVMQLIGNVMVPDITQNRPGIPPTLIASYLRGAISLLQRPTLDDKQRQVRYALGTMLLPKAQEFAPNLTSEFLGAMAMLAPQVPPEYTTDAAYKYLRKMPGALEDRIAEIEKMADSATRDQMYLDVVFQAYRKNRFEIAKLAASKIDNSKLQDELETIILFGETNLILKAKTIDLKDAFIRVEKMPNSLEKCLLRLALASVAAKAGNKKLEDEMLDLTRMSVKNLDNQAAPFMLLYISGKMKAKNDLQASTVFDEATKLFNKQDAVDDPLLEHAVTTVPPYKIRFPLKVEDVNLDFISIFQSAVKGDEEKAILLVSDIKDERLRGLAYVSLARAIIAKKPAPVGAAEMATI